MLYECEAAKNGFMNRSGYSPVQRQIGQWPRLPGSLMSDEMLDPALQMQFTSDDFDRTLELRQVAQDAFVKLASKDAAVKSLRARTRAQRIFKSGDVVYVFRALRKKKKKKIHGAPAAERGPGMGRRPLWIGPGHVLAMEGSVVWINMFGELWKAAVEQVREATTVEKLGVEVVAEDFSEMQERLKRSSRRAGFRDVTADAEELQEEDAVEKEGEEQGRPRVRFEQPQVEEGYSPSLGSEEKKQIKIRKTEKMKKKTRKSGNSEEIQNRTQKSQREEWSQGWKNAELRTLLFLNQTKKLMLFSQI